MHVLLERRYELLLAFLYIVTGVLVPNQVLFTSETFCFIILHRANEISRNKNFPLSYFN